MRIPLPVWTLTAAAFAIGTAEFVIAGILTDVSHSFGISEGQAGTLITVYALAIVIGGPILTLWLARFDKKLVLIGLMLLFVVANAAAVATDDFTVLLVARAISGLTQGPFYGIGAVIATRLVSDQLAGRAVGQMFAGLTLANVLGVPGGAWIGETFGWKATFVAVAILGALALVAIIALIPKQSRDAPIPVRTQLAAFRSPRLLLALASTVIPWTGFMTFYGYIAPVAERVAGFDAVWLTPVLVIVGIGLLVGNTLGGRTADANLERSSVGWPAAMVLALIIVGVVAPVTWLFVPAAFLFGVAAFANVPGMQLGVMRNSAGAPELAATANISAFNIANAVGGVAGGVAVDSALGPASVPFVAAGVALLGFVFVAAQHLMRSRSEVLA